MTPMPEPAWWLSKHQDTKRIVEIVQVVQIVETVKSFNDFNGFDDLNDLHFLHVFVSWWLTLSCRQYQMSKLLGHESSTILL